MFYVYSGKKRISQGYETEEAARAALLSGEVSLSNRRPSCMWDSDPITIKKGE